MQSQCTRFQCVFSKNKIQMVKRVRCYYERISHESLVRPDYVTDIYKVTMHLMKEQKIKISKSWRTMFIFIRVLYVAIIGSSILGDNFKSFG